MEFDVETYGGAAIWLVMMVLAGFAFFRAKTRRRHIGSGAAGAVYGMMSEEKRKAVEIVETKPPRLESRDLTDEWPHRLISQILLREAKTLIGGVSGVSVPEK